MIVNYYNKEYELKYDYDESFTPYICNTDKHTFGLKLKDSNSYLSASSPISFLDAEEKVFKKYQEYLKCNEQHEWIRTYDHATYGHCEKCKVKDPYKFDSPYICDHTDCNLSGEYELLSGYSITSSSENFCLNHYIEMLSEQTLNWIEKYEDLKDDLDAKEHILNSYFEKIVLDKYNENNLFEKMSRVELIELLSYYSIINLDDTLKNIFFDFADTFNIKKTNGVFWNFKYKITPSMIPYCAYYFLSKEKIVDSKELDLFKKELELIKETFKTLEKES